MGLKIKKVKPSLSPHKIFTEAPFHILMENSILLEKKSCEIGRMYKTLYISAINLINFYINLKWFRHDFWNQPFSHYHSNLQRFLSTWTTLPHLQRLGTLNPTLSKIKAHDVHKDKADVFGSNLEHKSPKNPTNLSRPFWPWRSAKLGAKSTVWICVVHPMFDMNHTIIRMTVSKTCFFLFSKASCRIIQISAAHL